MKHIISIFLCVCFIITPLCSCKQKENETGLGNGWEPIDKMELQYANQFSVEYYKGGFKLLTLTDGGRFLVIPEGAEVPRGISKDIVPLCQPLENIYLAATSVMGLFDALECLDVIKLSGTRQEDWYIENAAKAMENGDILYAGKYNEPDYEMFLQHSCPLAIESSMIGHASEVKEKLESLGIAVMVDRSSYESHPLGRSEWIRLYGALLNEEEKADALFSQQASYLESLMETDNTEKSVAFFQVSSSGLVITRKSGDYISKMIELAGGTYLFDNLGDSESNTSTTKIEMEAFYEKAKDADVIIYNNTNELIGNMDEFLALNELFQNFKAVHNGNVWCTTLDMFQKTMAFGEVIQNFNTILTNEDPNLKKLDYLYRLE